MRKEDLHLSDQCLLLAADGELSARHAAKVRAHLASCWHCRTRMAEVESTIDDFVRATRRVDPDLPQIGPARALLIAQLEKLERTERQTKWPWLLFGSTKRIFAFTFAALFLLAVALRALYERAPNVESTDLNSFYSMPLPNPSLTPGSVRAASLSEVCSKSHEEVVRRVPTAVRQQVFSEYGMQNVRTDDYEVDHLITPGLGGSDEIQNLWPEPRYHTEWNSYVKDQLEEHLHELVCSGRVSLVTAQRDIASNWIVAYRKYFGTDQPRVAHVVSSGASLFAPDNLAQPLGYAWLHMACGRSGNTRRPEQGVSFPLRVTGMLAFPGCFAALRDEAGPFSKCNGERKLGDYLTVPMSRDARLTNGILFA